MNEEQQIDKANDEFQEFVNAVNELNKQVNAELNHGVGFRTSENRKDFKVFFSGKVRDVQSRFHNMTQILNF